MILYNVTVKIRKEVQADWLKWMRETHIPDVMRTGLFKEHKICRIFEDDPEGTTYAIQYFCASMEDFQKYQTEFAQTLQADHTKRYEGQYVAFRTLMEVL